jgi:hypothetical protein
MKKTLINTAIAAALVTSVPAAFGTTMEFNWTGNFTMLDTAGAALANTSITTKGANQFQTPVTGTMAFDTTTGAGTATLVPFDFFAGTAPAEAVGINMQAIGDGMGGAGTLVMGNMLFNWNGNNGIPVSIVMDAAGFFGATPSMWSDGVLNQADVGATGALPASDGTYTNPTFGYLNTGPVPMATTSWDVTRAAACGTAAGACMGVGTSGVMPLVADTTANPNKYDMTTPTTGDLANQGIGGVPMWDGPFKGDNANFDILSMTMTNPDAGYTIAANCNFDPSGNCFQPPAAVPVPAAVWLFGSGLLGLVGVARRKKSAV